MRKKISPTAAEPEKGHNLMSMIITFSSMAKERKTFWRRADNTTWAYPIWAAELYSEFIY